MLRKLYAGLPTDAIKCGTPSTQLLTRRSRCLTQGAERPGVFGGMGGRPVGKRAMLNALLSICFDSNQVKRAWLSIAPNLW